jgi:serine/threonine protein phosphatase 1
MSFPIHGRFDLLTLALSKIEKNEPGTVIFPGDYIDRGPQSREVIERLIAGPSKGWKWICLLGNHEDMLVQASQSWFEIRQWLRNGGDATLRSYGSKTGSMFGISVVGPAHVEWMKTLSLTSRILLPLGGRCEGAPPRSRAKITIIIAFSRATESPQTC